MRSTGSMKRYFTTATQPGSTAFHCGSAFHYHSLPGGGWVVMMVDGGYDPDPSWTELPHLADPDRPPAYFDGIQPVLGTGTGSAPVAANATTQTVTTPAVTGQVTAVSPQSVSSGVTNSTSHQPLGGIDISDTTYHIAKKLAAALGGIWHP